MSESLYEDSTSAAPKAAKAPKSEVKPGTILDRLKETISKKVERSVVLVQVPEREGVQLKVSPNITQQQMKAWRRNAGEDTKNGMDATKFACYVVGTTTVGIIFNGEEVFDEAGYPLNFASADVLHMTETTRPIPEAVKAFFGVDPHIEAAALNILEAAGYSDTVDVVDPTTVSLKN